MPLVRATNEEPIPGYRLIEPLGSGGFAEVWKCEAPGGLFKAIKFVYGNLKALGDEGVPANQEFSALQRVKSIRHPFLLTMERVEIISGELMIVMELADRNLHDRFEECQKEGLPGIPRTELLGYLRDASEALDLMNIRYKLEHLDVKPRNLFLVSNRVKVADFGLVNHLSDLAGQSPAFQLGGITPRYAAPETFQGLISSCSDQYSLAITYQELLTGTLPFKGKNRLQLARQHVTVDPDLTSLPLTDQPAIARALAKNPLDRFPSCMALVRALASGRWKAPATMMAIELSSLSDSPETREELDLERTEPLSQADIPALAPPSVAAPTAGEVAGTAESEPTPDDLVSRLYTSAAPSMRMVQDDDLRYWLDSDGTLQHRFGTPLPIAEIRRRLAEFQGEWGATRVPNEFGLMVLTVPVPVRFWPFGRRRIEVRLQLSRSTPPAALTPVAVRLVPCRKRPLGPLERVKPATWLLRIAGPLFESLREHLQAAPEQRLGERLSYAYPLRVRALSPDRQQSEETACRGKDVSLTGMGLLMPCAPTWRRLDIYPPGALDPAASIAAEVVRARVQPDGQHDVGVQFLLAGQRQDVEEPEEDPSLKTALPPA